MTPTLLTIERTTIRADQIAAVTYEQCAGGGQEGERWFVEVTTAHACGSAFFDTETEARSEAERIVAIWKSALQPKLPSLADIVSLP